MLSMCLQIMYLIYMHKHDMALNSLEGLIYYKHDTALDNPEGLIYYKKKSNQTNRSSLRVKNKLRNMKVVVILTLIRALGKIPTQ